MAWTESRIETLKRLWEDGRTATEIAKELGSVSRNAVIGKAHRLGLKPTLRVTPQMMLRVSDLPFTVQALRLFESDNIIFVGDLIQKTETEFWRIPNATRRVTEDIKDVLADLDLEFGMNPIGWPPENIEESLAALETARKVSELRQASGGATFEPVGDHFAMLAKGGLDDLTAAAQPMTQQMQSALLEKVRSFSEISKRLNNQVGWDGIDGTVKKLSDLLDRPPAEIPDVLGYLYPTAIELGSFMELDQQLAADEKSFAMPLDPEVRRPLSDIVRNLAPWLRSFPSIRETDDQANRFLQKATELSPSFDVVVAAEKEELLTKADIEVFHQLKGAVERGEFQGEKAGGHAKRSATNLVIGVGAFLGTVYTGAIGSDVATISPLAQKASQFLVSAEISIGSLITDLPQDLSYAISEFMREVKARPLHKPQSPQEVRDLRRTLRKRINQKGD